MSNPGRLISTADAADRLGLSPRQVARLVPSQLTPAAKAPGPRGAYLFQEDEVAALAERRSSDETSSTSPAAAASELGAHSLDTAGVSGDGE